MPRVACGVAGVAVAVVRREHDVLDELAELLGAGVPTRGVRADPGSGGEIEHHRKQTVRICRGERDK